MLGFIYQGTRSNEAYQRDVQKLKGEVQRAAKF
jgi:hypothetical protein